MEQQRLDRTWFSKVTKLDSWRALVEEGDRRTAAAPSAPTSPKLDVLRAVAILLVLISHIDDVPDIAWLNAIDGNPSVIGLLGVLLFFVHTSLVLMFSLERHVRLNGQHRLFSTFMIRRLFRIYPLSMVVVTIVYFTGIPSGHIENHEVVARASDGVMYLANLLLVQNIVSSSSIDGPPEILGVHWSLPLELQMYLFLPLLFLLLRHVRNVRVFVALWFVSWIPELALRFLVGYPQLELGPVTLEIPQFFRYVPYFLPGIFAFALWRRDHRLLPFSSLPLLIAAIVAAGTVADVLFGHLRVGYLKPTDVTMLVGCLSLGLLLPRIIEPRSARLRSVCAQVAKYSYGIYLVHMPCIWFGFNFLDGAPLIVQFIVALGSTWIVSVALFHLVEQPMINVGAKLGRRWAGTPRIPRPGAQTTRQTA